MKWQGEMMRVLIHSAPATVLDETILQKMADFFQCDGWLLVGRNCLPKVIDTSENALCVTRDEFVNYRNDLNVHGIRQILTWDAACLRLNGFRIGNADEAPATQHPATSTGAQREKLNALPYDLVPFQEMTEAYARVAEFGARKYQPWNWSKGLSRVQLLGSLLRHAFAYLRGEECDKDSGLLHTDHILWNAVALAHNVHWGLEDGRRAEPPREYKDRAEIPLPCQPVQHSVE